MSTSTRSSVERYVIRHLAGSKANQVEEFDFKRPELTLGRATTCDVQFDPELDSVVSREHAKILKDPTNPLNFSLIDNGSRNGVFINKARVKGAQALHVGDEVQLGQNGPTFQFDLNPRPVELMPATRVMSVSTAKPTSEVSLAEVLPTADEVPHKTGLGKQTVERMLVAERKNSQRTVLFSVAGLVLVLGALGYVFRDKIGKRETTTVVVGDTTRRVPDTRQLPEQIAKANEDKVVFIEFGYQLFYTPTGDEVYHQYIPLKDGRQVAAYIEVSPGVIEPLLGLKKDVGAGRPIAMSGASGTGFVVSPDGFILTNRHVAASWNSYYDFPSDAFPGVLYRNDGSEWKIDPNAQVNSFRWVPSETQFFGQKPASGKILEGRNTYLDVTFAKNDLRTPAQLVRVSNKHDVAMIKVELPESLPAVKLKDADASVAPGQEVTVMGYPGISPDVVVANASNDFGNRSSQVVTVPDPTVTSGNIGRIIRGRTAGKADAYFSTLGDYYQLTINATGSGNSGGPLFDREGNVIGLFTASQTREDATRITFAVPIRYGMELMGTTKVMQ
jgi:S1-C subfamily serine protease/pSer/pThr/pTyr-binding forkhead associated (FHA) protein